MKTTLLHFIFSILFSCFLIFISAKKIHAQENIDKPPSKKEFKEGISFGLRYGYVYGDYTNYGNTLRGADVVSQYVYGFGAWDPQIARGGSYYNSSESSLVSSYSGYINIPINNNLQLVSEVVYKPLRFETLNLDYNFLYHSDPTRYKYHLVNQFKFTEIQAPIMLRGFVKWKIFEPYAMVGITPVVNVLAQRISKIDSLNVPDSFREEMEQNGYPTTNRTTKIKNGGLHFGFSSAIGTKVRIGDHFKVFGEFRYVSMFTKNVNLEFSETVSRKVAKGGGTVSVGIEYVLGRK